MVLRMLRVALPAAAEEHAAGRAGAGAAAGRRRLPGLPRAIPAPPNAAPVARFLLYERDYPDSVAFSVEALHAALTAADPNYRSSPAVLRAGRLMADLDFRARTVEGDGALAATLGAVQRELAQVDADIGQRYFGGTAPVAGRLVGA